MARSREDVRGVCRGRGRAIAKAPEIGEGEALRVERAGARERDAERRQASRGRRARDDDVRAGVAVAHPHPGGRARRVPGHVGQALAHDAVRRVRDGTVRQGVDLAVDPLVQAAEPGDQVQQGRLLVVVTPDETPDAGGAKVAIAG